MIRLDEREEGAPVDVDVVGKLSQELGVELKESGKPEAGPAVAIWLFDGSVEELPGGYDLGELSPNSPVKELKSFPQDLVLVGRSSILIKGLSNRLNIPWSLAKEWAPIARDVLHVTESGQQQSQMTENGGRVRFKEVWKSFKQWGKGRSEKVIRGLPSPIRTKVAGLLLRAQERKTRRKLMKRQN